MFFETLSKFSGFSTKSGTPDNWIMYVLYGIIVAFISAESIFYLVKSLKQAKELNMDMTKIKKVIKTSASFSILPAIGIGIGVVTLVGAIGIALPAIRLSVVGSLQYETQMADAAASAITTYKAEDGSIVEGSMTTLLEQGVTPTDYATIATVMTLSIILGTLLVLFFYKKLQPMLLKLGKMQVGGDATGNAEAETKNLEKDVKKKNPNGVNLGDLAFQVSFIGMIIGYLSMSIGTIAAAPAVLSSYYNFIAVIVAAIFMIVSDFLVKKLNWKWLDDFSTAFSMLFAMLIIAIISGTTGVY